jgi:hypothetical protein
MPRWLIVSFVAFLLSCYGFVTFAQVGASESLDGISKVATAGQDSSSPADPTPADADDDSAALDEASLDFTDCLTGGQPLLVAAVASAWPPQSASTRSPSPWLERPKRPPRGIALPV